MLKVEKLNEKLLEDVAGGEPNLTTGHIASSITGGTTFLAIASFAAGVGCCIASCVDFYKANKAKNSGNISDYNRYIKKAQNCTIANASLLGVMALSGVVSFATTHIFGDDINAYNAKQLSIIAQQLQ